MGLSRKEILERTDDAIDFAGLRKFEDTKLKNLSSGMQVRLAFSTAIQTDPDLLLVDEVLAVGDMEFQQKCSEVFNRYKKEGVTILFVSHDLGAVRRFCDKTMLLRNGEQEFFCDTTQAIDKYIYKPNEDEAEETKNGKENKKRTGSRKIEITGLKFIDKYGKENDNFVQGDPFTARIFYEAPEKEISPVFGILFYYQDTYCYGTTTEFKGYFTGPVYGKGYVDFIIERLPLIAGNFDVGVAVASPDNKILYDWHNRLYSFNVHSSTRDLGIFSMDGIWRASCKE
jgi:lipopolysaccharide transport system ATP-binding protein